MGEVFHGLPEKLTLFLRERFELQSMVETGTLHGSNARWAADHFAKVCSIELSEAYWSAAAASNPNIGNIEFFLGNSPEVLARVMRRFQRPLFWLDAHWSGGDTAGASSECPLLSEIAAIAQNADVPRVILIDDARLFLKAPPPPHRWRDWPCLGEVVRALDKCGDLHVAIVDDVIVAIPSDARADFAVFTRGQA